VTRELELVNSKYRQTVLFYKARRSIDATFPVGSVAGKKKTKRRSAAIEARQAAYRGLIVEAAEKVFATKGYGGAKIKDVADAAGLALGTVYALFPSKREVFSAVHANRGEGLIGRILAASQDAPSPLASLSRMLHAACEFYADHPWYLRMHLYSGTSWAAPRLDVEEERQIFDQGMGALVALFEQAASRGELVHDEPPERCARLCVAIAQVLLFEWEAGSLATPAAEVAARFERTLLRALAPAPSRVTHSQRRVAAR
jgi:AcrR family transcriptional regulator